MSTPPQPPGERPAAELDAAVPAIVSLFLPGLGLLLLPSRDRIKDAFLIFGVYVLCGMAVVGVTLATFGIGACCGVPLLALNVAAAIHSYDEAVLQQGGTPLAFQRGMRFFKD